MPRRSGRGAGRSSRSRWESATPPTASRSRRSSTGGSAEIASCCSRPSTAWSRRGRRSSCSSPATPASARARSSSELDKPIVRERGFFLSGKFDQYKRDIPYATLVQAFRELVLEILAESEEQIAAWRQRLLAAALGINGQLIVDVIPQVELVIGRQPPAPELPPIEAQNRFRIVFRRFIGVFAQKEHPLVLFLDDLQWADSASLGLLEELVTHAEVRHLLVIGAYRDNEVSPSHPLLLTLDEARKAGARVSEIVLGPIPREHLAAFVGEALHCRREDAAPLADLVHEKTAGNPFFAIQFLTALHEERLIEFDGRAGRLSLGRGEDPRQGLHRQRGRPDGREAQAAPRGDPGSAEAARLPGKQRGGRPPDDGPRRLGGGDARGSLGGRPRGARPPPGRHVQVPPRPRPGGGLFAHPRGERAAVHLRIGRLLSSRVARRRRSRSGSSTS